MNEFAPIQCKCIETYEATNTIYEMVMFNGMALFSDQYIHQDGVYRFNFHIDRRRDDVITVLTMPDNTIFMQEISTYRNKNIKGSNHK